MKINLTQGVKYIIDALYEAGYEAYVVGGAVRNGLLSRTVDDYDITTSASPMEIKSVFSSLRTVDTGIKHGTVTVIYEGTPYEVTTYRLDGEYGDNRHPLSVEFTRNLSDDLARRDFTVNAMCYNEACGIVDLYGGREDLKAGIIRTVGDASTRFFEDALRILRALRFASVLDFTIEEKTAQAILNQYPLLANVSSERVLVEIKKLLCGVGAHRIIEEYSEVIRFVFPELDSIVLPDKQRFLRADWRARLCSLFILGSDNPSAKLDAAMIRLRSDNKSRTLLAEAVSAYMSVKFDTSGGILRGLMRFGEEVMTLCADIKRLVDGDYCVTNALRDILSTSPIYRIRDLEVDGTDMRALGYSGVQIGEALERALIAVIDGECENSHTALLEYLKNNQA